MLTVSNKHHSQLPLNTCQEVQRGAKIGALVGGYMGSYFVVTLLIGTGLITVAEKVWREAGFKPTTPLNAEDCELEQFHRVCSPKKVLFFNEAVVLAGSFFVICTASAIVIGAVMGAVRGIFVKPHSD